MKLVLYGISCSGKDTFINTFLTEHSCFKHIHGSKRLSEISNEKYGADFQKLPPETQNNIRKAFVSKLTNMNNIIVFQAIMSLRQFSLMKTKIYMMYSCI